VSAEYLEIHTAQHDGQMIVHTENAKPTTVYLNDMKQREDVDYHWFAPPTDGQPGAILIRCPLKRNDTITLTGQVPPSNRMTRKEAMSFIQDAFGLSEAELTALLK